MLPATNIFSRFSFRIYQQTRKDRHVLVLFDGYVVQHFFVMEFEFPKETRKNDMSHLSPFIGLTWRAMERKFPRYTTAHWEPALWFFEDNPDPCTWLAGRWEFLKLYTCDHHVSSRLLTTIRKAVTA